MNTTTVIRNASWIVAWNKERQAHGYLRDADVAFCGDTLVFVGKEYAGQADTTIDGRGKMIMPGLVNIHAHLSGGPLDKGTFDEVGATAMWGQALYSHSPLLVADEASLGVGAVIALSELLMSGVTTVVDISGLYPEWVGIMAQSGIRAVFGPGFRQARWVNVNDHRVAYEWYEEAGWRGLEKALAFIDTVTAHPCGRFSGMVVPSQVDTCRPELIQAAHREARRRGIPFQTHAAQTMVEFSEMLRRHGKTPVQWLDHLGVLDDHTVLGHCIYLDHHSWTPLRTAHDLPLLAEKKVTVAHCPTVFGRTGMTLESFGRYVRSGVNLGIGIDSFPFNMLEELRHAAIYSRITAGDVHDLTTTSVFNAATTGGARALLREDIGRLTEGAKADLVVVDMDHPLMKPGREPLRNLIYVAAERAIKDVYVDGRRVVADGCILTLEYDTALSEIDAAQDRAISKVPQQDAQHRTLDEIAPMTFPVM
jgi:cytosine/adenosine deaminase-related metal-dependent hydrolase